MDVCVSGCGDWYINHPVARSAHGLFRACGATRLPTRSHIPTNTHTKAVNGGGGGGGTGQRASNHYSGATRSILARR